jgi:hypothetical protein
VITNNHVVGGRKLELRRRVGRGGYGDDPATDLALLKLAASGARALAGGFSPAAAMNSGAEHEGRGCGEGIGHKDQTSRRRLLAQSTQREESGYERHRGMRHQGIEACYRWGSWLWRSESIWVAGVSTGVGECTGRSLRGGMDG